MIAPSLPVKTVYDAALVLDRERPPLNPAKPADALLYVDRLDTPQREVVIEAASASANSRPFRWFLTGHTGTGKSTELNRIIADETISGSYIPELVSVKDVLDIHNLDFTDLILAMAIALTSIAKKADCEISKQIQERIQFFGEEIIEETNTSTQTEGQAGVSLKLPFLNLPFLRLGEEIKSGGSKRKTIRAKISDKLTDFIGLINDLANAIREKQFKSPLVIIDTLDHVDHRPLKNLFASHWASVSSPKISLLFVLPLPMLNEPEFMAYAGRNISLVPSVPIYASSRSGEIASKGFEFFKSMLARLAHLDLFTEEALSRLFILSAGVLRDMIGFAGDAAREAHLQYSDRVELQHVERVFKQQMAFFRGLLKTGDYKTLQGIVDDPYPKGIEGLSELLHLKAVLYYPNGERYYALHPAVKAIINGR